MHALGEISKETRKVIDEELCKNTLYPSILPEMIADLRFNDLKQKLKGRPIENRMCALRNYRRQSVLIRTHR